MEYGNVKESPSLKLNLLTSLNISSALCVCACVCMCVCVCARVRCSFSCQVELVTNALIKQTHGVNHIYDTEMTLGYFFAPVSGPEWSLRRNSRWWFIILQKCVNMMEKKNVLFPSDISNIL